MLRGGGPLAGDYVQKAKSLGLEIASYRAGPAHCMNIK